MTLSGAAVTSPPASPEVVLRTRALLGLAFVAAVAACGFDLVDRLMVHPDGGHQHVVPRLLAAVFAVSAGAAALEAFLDRAGRDHPRAREMRLLAVGLAVLWGGQAVGYIVTAPSPELFQGWVEQVPLLLSLPLLAAALVRICAPSGMTSSDKRMAVLDSAVAVLALAVVWWQVVVPAWVYPDRNDEGWERLDQLIMFGLAAVVLVIAVISRRIGSLPFPQLLLLMSGLAVQVGSDTAGQLAAAGDADSSVTWSIIGYAIAAALLVAMAHRAAVEVETRAQRAGREFVSIATPLVVVLAAGLVVIKAAYDAGEFFGWVGALAGLTVLLLLLAVAATRLASAYELRQIQADGVAEVLATRTREGWFKALVGDSAEGVLVVDDGGRVLYASPRFERDAEFAARPDGTWDFHEALVDSSRHDVELLLAQVAADPSKAGPYDLLVRGHAGNDLEMEAVIRPIADVEFQGFVVTARDVSDARRLARQLANSRRRDELTGLLSREAFLAETAALLDRQEEQRRVAVVTLDLERFGALNDGLGHETGDDILVAVASSFDRLPDEVHAAARLTSDTFALVLVSEDPDQAVGETIEQIRLELRGLILPDGRELELGFHAGYVVSRPIDGASAQWHIEAADLALARSRSSRNARLVGYHDGMRVETERRLVAESRLRRALAEDRIEVFYQPVVRLSDGAVTGSEALARLRDEDGRIVPPLEFIPIAEELGLIGEIGRVVLQKAASDTAALSEALDRPLHVAVNVAVDQLLPELVDSVADVLMVTGLPASRLSLEITESTLSDRSTTTQDVLATLRANGITVSLDDFGTGFSSLSYLAALPVDGLKIDRSFVSEMGTSRQSLLLSRVVVDLARSLDLGTVAEGVETMEQADLLKGMGCDHAQGYLYAPPLPLAEYEEYLRGPVKVVTHADLEAPRVRARRRPTT